MTCQSVADALDHAFNVPLGAHEWDEMIVNMRGERVSVLRDLAERWQSCQTTQGLTSLTQVGVGVQHALSSRVRLTISGECQAALDGKWW